MDRLKFIWDRLYGMRRKLATWGLFVFAAYLAVHVVFGANGWVVYEKKKAEYRKVSSDVEKMKEENQRLSEHIKALQTDKETIEKEAREQLKYARPGEVIYVLPAPPAKPDTNSAAIKKDSKN